MAITKIEVEGGELEDMVETTNTSIQSYEILNKHFFIEGYSNPGISKIDLFSFSAENEDDLFTVVKEIEIEGKICSVRFHGVFDGVGTKQTGTRNVLGSTILKQLFQKKIESYQFPSFGSINKCALYLESFLEELDQCILEILSEQEVTFCHSTTGLIAVRLHIPGNEDNYVVTMNRGDSRCFVYNPKQLSVEHLTIDDSVIMYSIYQHAKKNLGSNIDAYKFVLDIQRQLSSVLFTGEVQYDLNGTHFQLTIPEEERQMIYNCYSVDYAKSEYLEQAFIRTHKLPREAILILGTDGITDNNIDEILIQSKPVVNIVNYLVGQILKIQQSGYGKPDNIALILDQNLYSS